MAAGVQSYADKIRDGALRQFIASNRKEKVSVLIEVNAPEPAVKLASSLSKDSRVARPTEVRTTQEQREGVKTATEQTRALLDSLGLTYRFLRSARVFVVEATPSQLLRIVEAASVHAIIPNREVKQ